MGRVWTLFILKHLLLIHLNRLSLPALISSQFSQLSFITSIFALKTTCKGFITILVYEMPFKGHSWNTVIALSGLKLQKVNYHVMNLFTLDTSCTNMRTPGGVFSQLIPVHLSLSHTVILTAVYLVPCLGLRKHFLYYTSAFILLYTIESQNLQDLKQMPQVLNTQPRTAHTVWSMCWRLNWTRMTCFLIFHTTDSVPFVA